MKVMLVENDPAVVRTLKSLFSSYGYAVDVFSGQKKGDEKGKEACLRAAGGNRDYDLIILAVAFLSTGEISLYQELHQQLRDNGTQVPILLLIAREKLHQGITMLNADANDYVTKPFDAEALMARVAFLLRRTQETDRQQIEIQLQRQLDRERLMTKVTDSIRQTLDLDQILRTAVDQIRQFLQTDRVVVFRFESHWQGVVEAESIAPGWIETLAMKIKDSCLGNVYVGEYRQGRVSAIADVDAAEVDPYHRDLLKSLQVRANLVVPILQGEKLWGLLIAHHCSGPRQWKAESTQLLQQVSAHMAIAIQQAELYQKTREQAALIDIATDAIFVRDMEGRIVFWSQGSERLYGWKAEEAIGKIACQLLKEREKTELKVALSTTIEQGFWQGELTQFTKAGDEILVASRWTLVRDSSSRPQSLLEVNTDITDKKQLEAQFYQAQRLESLGQLAGGIAHDLGNILTPILGIAQMLRMMQKDADTATKEQLDILESSAKRGADMVRQILTFAQGNPGNETTIDVVTLLQEVVDVIKQGFPKSIKIRQLSSRPVGQTDRQTAGQPDGQPDERGGSLQPEHLAPSPRLVLADSTQLYQVFMNLCINARDAMPEGGVLTLSVDVCLVDEAIARRHLNAAVGHYVVVSVADTGVGIPPEIRDRIFEPFFTTKDADKGTGLGLATVTGIVNKAGGFLSVSSEVGQGTEMKVYLPALS